MVKHADIVLENNQLMLTGTLDFFTIMSVYANGKRYFQQCTRLEFNFSQLTASNSAGLALMIEWVKDAKKMNKPLCFNHVPEHLSAIIKAARIESLLEVV